MNMRRMISAWILRAAGAAAVLAWALVESPALLAFQSEIQTDAQESRIRDSVVKISATLRFPDITRPWSKQSPREVSGTGVVIDGKRILTNAHVVLYASQVFVESYQSSDKLRAEVEAVGPGIDLAVLRLEDESFFDKRAPMVRSSALPEIKETVLAYGYPTGGSTLSVTKGIVSRIEFTGYGEGISGVRVQIDAAINPGNSGGPALIDGKMVGLIFSKLTQAENIGYIIPCEEIDLFLDDVADHRYDGKPAMHESLQTLENAALRGFLGLDKKTQGMVVHATDPSNPQDPLRPFDVVTKIGSHEIDNTGMVKIRNNLRLNFHYLIQKVERNGKVPLTIVRQGKTQTIDLPVRRRYPMLIESLKGRYPSYFIYGPLVFSPATSEFASPFGARGGISATFAALIGSPLVTRRGDLPRFEGEELVVVAGQKLPHRIGNGYDDPISKVVKEVNGVPVKNLRHMVELLRDSKQKYTIIRFDDKYSETIVFDHQEALRATEEILSENSIRQQFSDDLASVWAKKR